MPPRDRPWLPVGHLRWYGYPQRNPLCCHHPRYTRSPAGAPTRLRGVAPSTSTGASCGRTNVTPLNRLWIRILAPGETRRHPPHPLFRTRHLRSSRRLLNNRIAPVQWRNAHRYWTGAALYFGERRLGEVRIPPVRWVEISRVVAPL